MTSKQFTTLTSLFLCLAGTSVAWCNTGSGGVSWSDIGNDNDIGEAFQIACGFMDHSVKIGKVVSKARASQ